MADFIKGRLLSKLFFEKIVQKIIDDHFPQLPYAACLIGPGSEVLGFDTAMSTDHHWGPRIMIFLNKEDFFIRKEVSTLLSQKLPTHFMGYSTHFSDPDVHGVQLLSDPVAGEIINHRVEFFTADSFFEKYLGVDIHDKCLPLDWFCLSEQKLRTIAKGSVFYDQINLQNILNQFQYYPKEVWYFLMAAEWTKIGQEEAFIGRTGMINDEIGSSIIASRLVHSLMRLFFLMDKEYAPYSKWFGKAFSELSGGKKVQPVLINILSSTNWKEREQHLSIAYQYAAEKHNSLEIGQPLPTKVSPFHDRPFMVIHGDNFAGEILNHISNPEILKIPAAIGSVNQITNTVDILENNDLLQSMKALYGK